MTEVNKDNAMQAARETRATGNVIAGPSSVRRTATVAKLAVALIAAQGELKNPPKDSINPHFKSKYADLATVRDTVLPVLVRHKLAVLQLPCELDGQPALTTILMHESGEWVETTIGLHPSKTDPQGIGSALTYARRYALQSLAGVAAEDDDDGNAASAPARPQQQAPKPIELTEYGREMVARIAAAKSRDEGVGIWEVFDADMKAGKIRAQDKAAIDAAFAELAKRFPKPQPAKA